MSQAHIVCMVSICRRLRAFLHVLEEMCCCASMFCKATGRGRAGTGNGNGSAWSVRKWAKLLRIQLQLPLCLFFKWTQCSTAQITWNLQLAAEVRRLWHASIFGLKPGFFSYKIFHLQILVTWRNITLSIGPYFALSRHTSLQFTFSFSEERESRARQAYQVAAECSGGAGDNCEASSARWQHCNESIWGKPTLQSYFLIWRDRWVWKVMAVCNSLGQPSGRVFICSVKYSEFNIEFRINSAAWKSNEEKRLPAESEFLSSHRYLMYLMHVCIYTCMYTERYTHMCTLMCTHVCKFFKKFTQTSIFISVY